MTVYERALEAHKKWNGKLDINVKANLTTKEDLALAYTPGVAKPCLEINKNPECVYDYTWKANTVAIVSDGTAVLGLGDIGPMAALPVMEGKAALFKKFANVDGIPIVLNTKDPAEIIQTLKYIAPTFGGINLEDISSPRCVEIERALIKELDIPVFHDDQHGTAIVTTAALINAIKLVGKSPRDLKVIISGAGAAGFSIVNMIKEIGIKNILVFNSKGIINAKKDENYNFVAMELSKITNLKHENLSLKDAMQDADVFIGVSVGNVLDKEMIRSMNKDAIVFAMANPEPEVDYHLAKSAGARVVGTGRSDFPNQINNLLAFPGVFRGALDVRASKISEKMKMAAAHAIAEIAESEGLKDDYIIPSAFNEKVAPLVAKNVTEQAIKEGLARI